MNPSISSLLGVLMLAFGAIAIGIMLEIQGGRVTDEARQRRLKLIHRICGYCFVAIYLILLGTMVWRIAQFREDLSPRALVHAGFALAILPLLVIKILILRRYPRLFPNVFPMAVTVFCLSFVFISLSAGYYYLSRRRRLLLHGQHGDLEDEDRAGAVHRREEPPHPPVLHLPHPGAHLHPVQDRGRLAADRGLHAPAQP
ncbi:MAG: hypothetical protein EXS64_05420 [Candidatus Latescibacteria bacterium]|nr:hypothetical protein [Candidatus Latescibacterota bacterium]